MVEDGEETGEATLVEVTVGSSAGLETRSGLDVISFLQLLVFFFWLRDLLQESVLFSSACGLELLTSSFCCCRCCCCCLGSGELLMMTDVVRATGDSIVCSGVLKSI